MKRRIIFCSLASFYGLVFDTEGMFSSFNNINFGSTTKTQPLINTQTYEEGFKKLQAEKEQLNKELREQIELAKKLQAEKELLNKALSEQIELAKKLQAEKDSFVATFVALFGDVSVGPTRGMGDNSVDPKYMLSKGTCTQMKNECLKEAEIAKLNAKLNALMGCFGKEIKGNIKGNLNTIENNYKARVLEIERKYKEDLKALETSWLYRPVVSECENETTSKTNEKNHKEEKKTLDGIETEGKPLEDQDDKELTGGNDGNQTEEFTTPAPNCDLSGL